MISVAALSALREKAGALKNLGKANLGMGGLLNMPSDGDNKKAEIPLKTASQMKAEKEFGNIERYNDEAKNTYFRKKLSEVMAAKNPKAWYLISQKWADLAKDPVSHNSQARQRASFEVDKGQTRLSKEELQSILGSDYEEFMRLRKANNAFNTGLVRNTEEEMQGFGFDDLASTMYGGTWEDKASGRYYRPEYEDGELYVDTNIPSLSHLVRKKKKADGGNSVAKQAP